MLCNNWCSWLPRTCQRKGFLCLVKLKTTKRKALIRWWGWHWRNSFIYILNSWSLTLQNNTVIGKWFSVVNICSFLSFFVVVLLCLQRQRSGVRFSLSPSLPGSVSSLIKINRMTTFVAFIASHFLTVNADSAGFKWVT